MIDWVNRLSKHRLFIVLFSLLVCVAVVATGLLYWYSEQLSEQKLQKYIRRLNSMGCIVEERPLSDFHVDHIQEDPYWNDFSLEVDYEEVDHIYHDRGKHLLYFIRPKGDGIEAEAFNYKWKISDLFA